jgi:hypothetical protein
MALPWFLLAAVIIGHISGWGEDLAALFPNQLGQMAWKNSFAGVLIAFVVCAVIRAMQVSNKEQRNNYYVIAGIFGYMLFQYLRLRLDLW